MKYLLCFTYLVLIIIFFLVRKMKIFKTKNIGGKKDPIGTRRAKDVEKICIYMVLNFNFKTFYELLELLINDRIGNMYN